VLNLTMAGALIFTSAAFVRIDTGVALLAGLTGLMFIVREVYSTEEPDNDR
jgi:hypothetical protein